MSKNDKVVWSSEQGDLRKHKDSQSSIGVVEKDLLLKIRRITAGKGRNTVEIKGLPSNTAWSQALAKELKKKLGVGGTFKKDYIEIHCDKIEKVMEFLDKKSLRWKKTGG